MSGAPLLTLPAGQSMRASRRLLAERLRTEPFAVRLLRPGRLRAFTERSFEVAPECAVLVTARFAVRCFYCPATVRCSCSRQPERRCSCVVSEHVEPLEVCVACGLAEPWPAWTSCGS